MSLAAFRRLIKTRHSLAAFLIWGLLPPLLAQETPLPCGTPNWYDAWRERYLHEPARFYTSAKDTPYLLPLQLYLIHPSNASPHRSYAISTILDALCQLNEDFKPTGIRFYLYDSIRAIASDEWTNHEDILTGIRLMQKHQTPGVINCYIVRGAAGTCGYNIPYAGITLNHSCLGKGQHTWTHEIGHHLSLPHTFLGWEGKKYHPDSPTPKILVYDYTLFKDSLITDTVIYDTAEVELADGSNCQRAADGFCDTSPDYLSYRWECDDSARSTFALRDYQGQRFYADGSLYMSYAVDECQSRFSDEQTAFMWATIHHKRPYLLDHTPPTPQAIEEEPILLAPRGYTFLDEDDRITFRWSAVDHAEWYVVEVAINKSLSRLRHRVLTSDTSIALPISSSRKHWWRVTAFNRTHFCVRPTSPESFIPESASRTKEHSPTMKWWYAEGYLHIQNPTTQPLYLQLVTIHGKVLFETQDFIPHKTQRVKLPLMTPGLYIVKVCTTRRHGPCTSHRIFLN